MNSITAPLAELKEFQEIKERLGRRRKDDTKGALFVCGCIDSQKAHFIKGIGEDFPCRLIITHQEARAKELFEDYQCFDKHVVYYPAKDFIFYSADIHGNLIVKERIRALKRLFSGEDLTIITTIDGCMDKLLPPSVFKDRKSVV